MIAAIITLGFGSFSGVNCVPTLGFTCNGGNPSPTPSGTSKFNNSLSTKIGLGLN